MEEIQVGEYVRIAGGIIAKVINKNNDCILTDKVIKDPFRQDGTIRDWAIFNDEKRLILKHSFNLIDLIEENDYVNGKKIEDIIEPNIKSVGVAEKILFFETDFPIEKGLRCYHDCDIKSIVTHEQFSSLEYKVED